MKLIHQACFAAGLLILGTITWRILTPPKPPAGWLQVEAPGRLAPGETFILRVTLVEPDENLQLVADLHGKTRRNQPLGVLSHGHPRRARSSAPAVDFTLAVPAHPDLASAQAVIYLSPTGNWQDRTRVAKSEELAVEPKAGSSLPKLEPLPAYEFIPERTTPRVESAFLRHVIVGLWLAVAFILGLQAKRDRSASLATPPTRLAASVAWPVAACLAAVLVELLGAEQGVQDRARQFVLRHGYYDLRHQPQQIAVLLMVVGAVAGTLVILRRARRRRLLCGLLLYAAISLTATLSLHETDALLYATVLGLSVEQLAKLVAVGLSLSGLHRK